LWVGKDPFYSFLNTGLPPVLLKNKDILLTLTIFWIISNPKYSRQHNTTTPLSVVFKYLVRSLQRSLTLVDWLLWQINIFKITALIC
jgi:hypothetical protein